MKKQRKRNPLKKWRRSKKIKIKNPLRKWKRSKKIKPKGIVKKLKILKLFTILASEKDPRG